MRQDDISDLPRFTWSQHLEDLRHRVLWIIFFFTACFLAVFPFSNKIFYFLLKPLCPYLIDHKVIYTTLYGQFMANVKVTFLVSFFLSIPFFIYQAWLFLAPALFRSERRALYPLFILAPFLFYSGVGFSFYLVVPMAWKFFAHFQMLSKIQIILLPEVGTYCSFIGRIFLLFGLAFELPIIIFIAVYTQLVSYQSLKKCRRYAICCSVILSAIFTPPDPLSQILFAVPLYILYECGIWIAWGINARFKKHC